MKPQDILRQLRQRNHLTQDQLAEKLFVTRQAVSRWEAGETTPNVETLKELSRLFDVSINTLLGSPPQPGLPMLRHAPGGQPLSREPDGTFNEDYCKWCYADGKFVYANQAELLDFLAQHMSNESWPPDQVRAHFEGYLPTLKHWRKGRIDLPNPEHPHRQQY